MLWTDLTRFWEDKEVSLLMKNDIITELEGLKLHQQGNIDSRHTRIDANRTCPFLTAFHHVRPPWTSSLLTPHHVPRAKGSLKAGKEQTKKFEGKAKEDGEKLGDLLAKEHLQAFKQCK